MDGQREVALKREPMFSQTSSGSIGRLNPRGAVLRPHMPAFRSHDNILRGVVESDSLPSLDRGDGHAQSYRMAIARFDVGIWPLPALHTLHPVSDVCYRGVV